MDQLAQALTAMLLGSGHPFPDDLMNPPTAIAPLRVYSRRHYVFARTMMVKTTSIESSGLNLEEVIVGEQVYRVSRAVIGDRQEGALRVLTAHTPSDNGWSRCTVVATRQKPWTPEVAITVLRHAFGGISEISDGLWHPEKVTRITEGAKVGLFELMDSTSTRTDTYTIIGHVLSGPRAESKLAVLETVLAEYPWLVNATLLIDPNRLKVMNRAGGHAPERWIDGFFHTHAYLLNLEAVASVDGLVSAPSPADLHTDTVRTWIKEAAVARCSYKWPHRPFVHALVEHFGDWLRGSRSAPPPPPPAAPEVREDQGKLIEQLRIQLAEANARIAEESERADGLSHKLHTCEGQLTRAESSVKLLRMENKDLHTQVRLLRTAPADLHIESQEPVGEQQQDEEDVTVLLESCENAPGILRTPWRWDELLECAKQLPHVSVTAEAVEPALKRFARHRHSSTILATAWNALRALDAWMAVPTGERGTFQKFLIRHPQKGMPPGRVAGGETAKLQARDKMRNARVFKTALGDELEMFAHVKLNKEGGANAARLHYREDPELDVAHVGHIGPHLLCHNM